MCRLLSAITLGFLFAAALFVPLQGANAEYPDRNIMLIVPFAPGGANDAIARVMANQLSSILGKAVVVENRPGAGGVIGSAYVARSQPDGYTLLLISPAHAINAHLVKSLPFHTLTDFTPISQLTRSAYVLVTPAKANLLTIADIEKAARQPNTQIKIATPGTGSAPYLAAAVLSHSADLNAILVPYQGGSPALAGLLRGDVDMYFSSYAGARGFLQSKQLNAVAVSSDTRIKVLPDTPTLAEAGVKNFAINGWYGIIGPAKMPPDVVQKLDIAISTAMKNPDVVRRIEQQGEEPVGSSAAAFAALLQREYKYYQDVVRTTGLKPR
jgi:tripartite-type tricarboxylate transporter receptor subunit TctC